MSTAVLRPGYEGANIRTWVGFKHFMYLAEAAVLDWFRERGHGPGRLYHDHGLELSVVDSSVLLPAVLDVDDEVRAEVSPVRPGRFTVRLRVPRDGAESTVLRGKVSVALVGEPVGDLPEELAALVTPAVRDSAPGPAAGGTPFVWQQRAPYYYAHYSQRLAHSAYVRTLEETVDRFLADRGLSVGRMLTERAWIPVVSRAQVRLLADAYLEETVHTAFSVTDVHRSTTYDARMDCHVVRDGRLVPVATARIQHGYAISRGPDAGSLATLDPDTVAALTGGRP